MDTTQNQKSIIPLLLKQDADRHRAIFVGGQGGMRHTLPTMAWKSVMSAMALGSYSPRVMLSADSRKKIAQTIETSREVQETIKLREALYRAVLPTSEDPQKLKRIMDRLKGQTSTGRYPRTTPENE